MGPPTTVHNFSSRRKLMFWTEQKKVQPQNPWIISFFPGVFIYPVITTSQMNVTPNSGQKDNLTWPSGNPSTTGTGMGDKKTLISCLCVVIVLGLHLKILGVFSSSIFSSNSLLLAYEVESRAVEKVSLRFLSKWAYAVGNWRCIKKTETQETVRFHMRDRPFFPCRNANRTEIWHDIPRTGEEMKFLRDHPRTG